LRRFMAVNARWINTFREIYECSHKVLELLEGNHTRMNLNFAVKIERKEERERESEWQKEIRKAIKRTHLIVSNKSSS
jgi:hypothetical protein